MNKKITKKVPKSRIHEAKGGYMKILSIAAVIVVALAVAAAGFLAYMGVFTEIKASEMNVGPYTYVYERFVGPYEDSGAVFSKLYKSLLADGIKTGRAIGIYYDNPKKVPAKELRSDCGCIINEKDFPVLPRLLEKYQAKTLPAGKRLAAEFPYRNRLSYMIGPVKVYPVLMKYVREKGLKISSAIEIYDMPEGKIIYAVDTE